METKDKKQVIIRWDVILTSIHIIALILLFFNIFNYDVTSKYILCLWFIIFCEGLFICYIKKIIPRINRFILRILMTILVRSHVNVEYHVCEWWCEGTWYIPIMFFVQEILCIILCVIWYIISRAIKITE